MARPSKPYYWEARGYWRCTINGVVYRLADGRENKAEALREFHRLMADEGPAAYRKDLTVEIAADLFLDHAQRETVRATYEQYRFKLQSFATMFGKVKVTDLRPSHVSKWLSANQWSQSTQRGAITYLKLMIEYAVRERMIRENPLSSVKRPKATRRKKTLTVEDRAQVIAAGTDRAWTDLIFALTHTGARPGEIAKLEAQHIDWTTREATLKGKTSRVTGEDRVIILTPGMADLCRRLAETNPTGPLFRNARGGQWTTNAMRCRFRRYKTSKGIDKRIGANTFRHSFITDGLEQGASVAAMAALAGHTDLKMVSEVYSHLKERREHLRAAAEMAAGVKPGSEPVLDDGARKP